MPGNFEIRGVPRGIALDAWWLDATIAQAGGADGAQRGGAGPDALGAGRRRGPGTLVLVLLGDFLFWDHAIGISLAIFAIALTGISGIRRPVKLRIRAGFVCLLGALPLADHVQPLSLIFLAGGVIAAIVVLHAPDDDMRRLAGRAFGFVAGLPRQWLRSLAPLRLPRRVASMTGAGSPKPWARAFRDWAFPVGGSLVFLALLMDANPVFLTLGMDYIDPWRLLQRGLLWTGIGLFAAPFLMPGLPEAQLPALPGIRLPGLGLNPQSVLRALVMFNLLIGIQVISDTAILFGGAALPRGMTYAEYAHRGAYPLLATAMLAGAFALLARPFRAEHRLIRPLMLLWLVQNIVLTGAAALRLDLYIDAYGLTYLRLYALVWMALVALGLGLSILQTALDRDTLWLAARVAALGGATLYASAFVNFAAIIAAQNLARPEPDLAYVCALGPMAAGALHEAGLMAHGMQPRGLQRCAARKPPQVEGWRDWGLRSWKVNRMLDTARLPERAG